MTFTDQPIRYIAVFVFAPFLIYSGMKYKDKPLLLCGIIFLIFEIFCILCVAPRTFKF